MMQIMLQGNKRTERRGLLWPSGVQTKINRARNIDRLGKRSLGRTQGLAESRRCQPQCHELQMGVSFTEKRNVTQEKDRGQRKARSRFLWDMMHTRCISDRADEGTQVIHCVMVNMNVYVTCVWYRVCVYINILEDIYLSVYLQKNTQ